MTPLAPERLRVALISDAAPERNGVGTYYWDLRGYLEERCEDVRFLCPENEDQDLGRWFAMPLPGDSTQRIVLPSPFKLSRALREARPHVVVAATPGPFGVLGAWLAKRQGLRLVSALHTDYENLTGLYWGSLLAPINRWYLTATTRYLLHQADAVMAVSEEMTRLARAHGVSQCELVGTLCSGDFLRRPPAPLDGLRNVLFVGRLAAEKRVMSVIEAARALPELRFRIAGDGPQRAEIEAAAGPLANVDYLGWVDRHRILELLDAADLLVLPSKLESFGTVALEALARGRSALVSRGCGIRDWPEFADSLYVMGEDEDVTAAIRRIATEAADQRRARGARGRAAVQAMNDAAVERWLEVLMPPAAPGQVLDREVA